ncbi:hypothetical protein IT575_15605 [bacterium]|nr:hypothetical protein [bacterium]
MLIVLLCLGLMRPAGAAMKVNIESRFVAEQGFIADAAVMGNGHIGLAYPDAGHICEYTKDGSLYKHLVREAGVDLPFRPSVLVAGPGDDILVFDEAEQAVFEVEPDGNFSKGLTLAYETGSGKTVALSKVGDLAWQPELRGGEALPVSKGYLTWAMLPERGEFACFNGKGKQVSVMSLANLLPYESAMYTRAQWGPNKALFVLDYSQGAVLYQRGGSGAFRRIRVLAPPLAPDGAEFKITAAPTLQDFAVDEDGNIIAATTDEKKALMLLTPGAKGYDSRRIDLKLKDPGRLAVRYSRGRFVVWQRETAEVLLLRLQP